ncbi:MAG: hypothetical protein M1530_03290 [Candidatus Marsarchaeota archaeon]|nr:hypothetical protein [Candidatus Marsarchaeota archaeon]
MNKLLLFAILASLASLMLLAGCVSGGSPAPSAPASPAGTPPSAPAAGAPSAASPFPADITADSGLNESIDELDAVQ